MQAELSGDFETWPREAQVELQQTLRLGTMRAIFAELDRATDATAQALANADFTTEAGVKSALRSQGLLHGKRAFLAYLIGIRDDGVPQVEEESAG